MRHSWTKDPYDYEICKRCGMQRREVIRSCPGINPLRQKYKVWEYRKHHYDGYSCWFWVRTREKVPPCKVEV